MKLIYRGVTYDYNPDSVGNKTLERSASPTHATRSLIYRGHTYQVNSDVASPPNTSLPEVYTLIYRGATYQVRRKVHEEPVITPQAANAAVLPDSLPVPASLPRRYLIQHTAQVHQANLLKNLSRRLKVAQERGDKKLVQLLEAELQQLAPNRSLPV